MSESILDINIADLSEGLLGKLIHKKQSFRVVAVADMAGAIKLLEKFIDAYGMRSRVYTEYRAGAAAASLALGGIGGLALASIAAHNLVTLNPDYEIGKDIISNSLTVLYKKHGV